MDDDLSSEDISSAYRHYISEDVEELDKLVEEVLEVESTLKELSEKETFANLDIGDKWAQLLKNKNVVHLRKLVAAILSVFPSNAHCESVFSIVNALWMEEKSRFAVETIDAFISVKSNSELL